MTAPHPEGIGVIAVMKNCLENAGINPEDVDHINTHGTSTPLGDVAELKAISEVFGEHAKEYQHQFYKINDWSLVRSCWSY